MKLMCTLMFALALLLQFANSPELFSQHGVKTEYIDRAVDPCSDFFMFATGAWQKSTEIPADRSSWGSGYELLEQNLTDLKSILDEAAAANAPVGSDAQKIGDLFLTGMDTNSIEAMGTKSLAVELAAIAAIKDANGLVDQIARFQKMMINVPFSFEVYQDAKNSSRNIIQFYQAGLGMPDRDYYLNDDDDSEELRGLYRKHVANMFELLGDSQTDAATAAETVFAIETRLARASMTQVEQRDPDALYNIVTRTGLKVSNKEFNWDRYFDQFALADPGEMNSNQPAFIEEVAKMMVEVPIADWQTYFRWHLIHETAPYLNSAFVNEDFDFYGKTLSGRKELRARWKRVMGVIDYCLGELLGKLYVERFFSAESKQRVEEIVLNLKASFRDRLSQLDWISETTRQRAYEKLDAMGYKLGYPDRWRDYSKLEIKRDSYVQNVLSATQFEFRRNLDKLGKPVDRGEWFMTAATVNAYYDANLNEVVFPAGILQPPYFDPKADDALNYGGIGAIIGHELTHGFDDEGRKYDAEGNLKDWWTEEDTKRFEERARVIEEQFDGYIAVDTLRVNGELTAGENIADLGGLIIAYYAYQKSLVGKPRPPDIDGFTPEQRFFLSYAESWRTKTRNESMKMRLATDPHSPEVFRVNGPVSNMAEFAEAFGCKSDSLLMRPVSSRVNIW